MTVHERYRTGTGQVQFLFIVQVLVRYWLAANIIVLDQYTEPVSHGNRPVLTNGIGPVARQCASYYRPGTGNQYWSYKTAGIGPAITKCLLGGLWAGPQDYVYGQACCQD